MISSLQPHRCLASLPPFPDGSDQVRLLQLCKCSVPQLYQKLKLDTRLYYAHTLIHASHVLSTQVVLMTVGPDQPRCCGQWELSYSGVAGDRS